MAIPRLTLEDTAVLVVDLQQRLVPVMREPRTLVRRARRLVEAANVLSLPVLATEQYPRGLGPTVPELDRALSSAVCVQEKTRFSAWVDPVKEHLDRLGRGKVLIAGVETHVCVMQTCFDLMEAGYAPAVAFDAVGSRRQIDAEMAAQRMTAAGVIPTTVEAAVLEMVGGAQSEHFRAIHPLIKSEEAEP